MEEVSPDFAAKAFNIVEVDSAIAALAFTHELGHNLGARHDRYMDPTDGAPFDYNHGLVDLINKQRSIMAYSSYCRDQGFSCPVVPSWSSRTFGGYNWSDTHNRNDLTITQTAYTVANFRNPGNTLSQTSTTYP